MPTRRASIADALDRLEAESGPVPPAPPSTPFGWVVYEAASYLVDDERRERVFRAVEAKTALDPDRVARLSESALRALIADGGMQPAMRAEKVRECAALAKELGGGDLRSLLGLPAKEARAALRRFPGIGEPGADFILLACGVPTRPSVESNGLRTLGRLGFARTDGTYAAQYRSAVEALERELPPDPAGRVRARELLRRHGQTLCRRTAPACPACVLRAGCPWASSALPDDPA